MKYQYKVKNFRVFDEEGVKLDMAPITILTGCNSSGKSSFVKSMLLVNSVLNKLSLDGTLHTGINLDFTEKPNNLLGTFDNVIHRGSESKNITVEYTVPSMFLNEDVVVAMTFDRYWKLNGGILSEITISRMDGSVIFHTKPLCDDHIASITTCCADLRQPFFRYLFAKKNGNLITIIQPGTRKTGLLYEEVAEKENDKGGKVDLMKNLKAATENMKPYYFANKEWIDKILTDFVPAISKHDSNLLVYDDHWIT